MSFSKSARKRKYSFAGPGWYKTKKSRPTIPRTAPAPETSPATVSTSDLLETPQCSEHQPTVTSHAPTKPKVQHNKKLHAKQCAKRKLFDASKPKTSNFVNDTLTEIQTNLPVVAEKLHNAGCLLELKEFVALIAEDKFPLQNISFRLFLETVRWFSQITTTSMWYWNDTTKFWKFGYRLFGDKFALFMSGLKSTGNLTSGEESRGTFKPSESNINFAVPSLSILRAYNKENFPQRLKPGIITQALNPNDVTDTRSYIVSVDGKKLVPGVDSKGGDIDLFGHGPDETAAAQKEKLDKEIEGLDEVIHTLTEISESNDKESTIRSIKTNMKQTVVNLGSRLHDVRSIKCKQAMTLEKLDEKDKKADENRYIFAKSSIRATIHQIDEVVTETLSEINVIVETCSALSQSHQYVSEDSVSRSTQKNWVGLKPPSSLPVDYADNSNFIMQRSDEWHENRSKYKITGSTLHNALGLRSLSEQKKHFDKVIHGKEVVYSPETLERMQYGTDNEPNAVATMTAVVLPFLFPDTVYIEVGSYVIDGEKKNDPLFFVSPDGRICLESSCEPMDQTLYGCEFKCPPPAKYKLPVVYEMPHYYVCQVQAEMKALQTDKLLFLCYGKQSSTVFDVTFDQELWDMLIQESEDLYLCGKPKRPTKTSKNVGMIKSRIQQFVHNNVTFLGEFPSRELKKEIEIVTADAETPFTFAGIDNSISISSINEACVKMAKCLDRLKKCIQTLHHLCRRKATEVLVWLLQDSDRSWKSESPHSSPIAYAMKGYSLSMDVVRSMSKAVLSSCISAGKNVVGMAFDGQLIPLLSRTDDGRPLTLLQLQKDVWADSRKKTKQTIVTFLRKLGRVDISNATGLSEICEVKNDSGNNCLFVSSVDGIFDSYRKVIWKKLEKLIKESRKKIQKSTPENNTPKEGDIGWLPEEALQEFQSAEDEQAISIQKEISGIELPLYEHVGDDSVADVESDSNEETVTVPTIRELTESDMELIYSGLCDVQQKWKTLDLDSVRNIFTTNTVDKLMNLSVKELNVIIDSTEKQQIKHGKIIYKSWSKTKKSNAISSLVGDVSQRTETCKSKDPNVLLSLSQLAINKVESFPKFVLNAFYSVFAYKKYHKAWIGQSPVGPLMDVEGVPDQRGWFSYPEVHAESNRPVVKCIDGHHLLVNLRVKICKDGVQNVNKEAWHRVAEQDSNIISKSIVVDIVDKQRNSYAKRTFSEDVEQCMRDLGYNKEADFCRIVRHWYQAEDDRSISAIERMRSRIEFRDYLLKDVAFDSFPPYGMFIKGFPYVSFEGFVSSIDSHVQLYSLCTTGTYNQRAFSSLENETFFGMLGAIDATKLGCPRAVNIDRILGTITELMHYRQDPENRIFLTRTSRSAVYPEHKPEPSCPQNEAEILSAADDTEEKDFRIVPKDHFFDKEERARAKPRRKTSRISGPSEPGRGVLPVRQHHRTDESLILPERRLGIS